MIIGAAELPDKLSVVDSRRQHRDGTAPAGFASSDLGDAGAQETVSTRKRCQGQIGEMSMSNDYR